MLLHKSILIPAIIALLSGCASIVSDSKKTVTITSLPSQAEFMIVDHNGKAIHNGVTPTTVTLKSDAEYFKGEKYTIKFQKEGFGPQSSPLNAKLNPWYWGNILFGYPIGMFIVDPITGAMWTLPESKSVVLAPTR